MTTDQEIPTYGFYEVAHALGVKPYTLLELLLEKGLSCEFSGHGVFRHRIEGDSLKAILAAIIEPDNPGTVPVFIQRQRGFRIEQATHRPWLSSLRVSREVFEHLRSRYPQRVEDVAQTAGSAKIVRPGVARATTKARVARIISAFHQAVADGSIQFDPSNPDIERAANVLSRAKKTNGLDGRGFSRITIKRQLRMALEAGQLKNS